MQSVTKLKSDYSLGVLNCNFATMSIWRVILAIIFPPLAVIGKGCGSILIVLILTCLGWIPGVIAALIILNNPEN
ncbi:hypothetical protein ULMA_00860 [Patiriisocius marinus]|uniref:YqaE/Pmp3 family membrane protein n=2 Tax=Patiriisocius marinus TaxID=1397112 RepID=A0A5J4IWR4_9FLAO|nr:hypothetical protein ULMA_00860 [Patiriisocius marinus]